MKVTLSIDEKIFRAAKTYAATQNNSLSFLVEKALSAYMPTVISVVNPRDNMSPTYQGKLDQAQQLISDVNLGTAPMNSLPATVTQKMAEGIKYSQEEDKV